MSSDIEPILRNAADLIRASSKPFRATGTLLGLVALSLEDRLLQNGSWPKSASWSGIQESASLEAIQEAVQALKKNKETAGIGRNFEQLGLTDAKWLWKEGLISDESVDTGKASLGEAFIEFVNGTDLASFTAQELSRLTYAVLEFGDDISKVQGQFYTPRFLAELIAEVLDPEPGAEISDPTVGTGGLLFALKARAGDVTRDINGEETDKSRVFGQDINTEIAALAEVNAYLHGVCAEISVGDTLTDPQLTRDGSLRTFDYVAANPPINLEANQRSRKQFKDDPFDRFGYGPPSRRLDTAFIQHVASTLNEQGRAAIVVSPRLLNPSGQDQKVFENLLQDGIIEAVVQLPSGLLPYTGIPVALLILSRNGSPESNDHVLLVDASDEYEGERDRHIHPGQRRKIASIVNNRVEKDGFSILISTEALLENNAVVSPQRYILLSDLDSYLGGLGDWRLLEDIAEIKVGRHIKSGEHGNRPVLTPHDFPSLPSTPNALQRRVSQEANADVDVTCCAGDVVLQVVGHFKAAQVPAAYDEVAVNRSIAVLRLQEEFSELGPFLVNFFGSDVGQRVLSAMSRGYAMEHLSDSSLREVRVPIPDAKVLSLMSQVRSLQKGLRNKIQTASSISKRVFNLNDPEGSESEIRGLTADVQVLRGSLLRTDDLDYQIRNFYPFPIAYSYRGLAAISEPAQRHKEILRVVENLISFLASVGLATGVYEGLLPKSNDPNLGCNSLEEEWRGGISLGTWKKLAYLSGKELRNNSSTDLAADYASIWRQAGKTSSFFDLIDDLVRKRNDAKHGRGPTTQIEYKEGADELYEMLQEAYGTLSFFVKYPLRFVLQIDMPWCSDHFEVETLSYMGDHPGMRRESVTLSKPVSRRVLYIEAGNDEWIPLYPLVSVLHCPTCKLRETYVLDKWNGEDRYHLKSFERGHGIEPGHLEEGTLVDHLSHLFQ